MNATALRCAQQDPSLAAVMLSRRKLLYRNGADTKLDRPAHVRAGSSLTWVGDRLALVQDDANFVAVIDPTTGLAEAIPLPAGEAGLRQFDDLRGNKKFKLDLEACCTVDGPHGPQLLAFGSGSKKRRRRVAILDRWSERTPHVSLIEVDSLYVALEAAEDFAGSDLNIEGALALPNTLRLFGRGNGKPRNDLLPLNATCDLSLALLLAFLTAPDDLPPPKPTAITQYDLGTLGGLDLGFTDATRFGDAVLYTAAAENSETASDDGPVTGSVIGLLPPHGDLRYARLVDEHGVPTRDKIEGVAAVPGTSNRVFVVIDADDGSRPSELCEVRLAGDWL